MLTVNDITDDERKAIIEALDNNNRVNLKDIPSATLASLIDHKLVSPKDSKTSRGILSSIDLTINGYLLAKEFLNDINRQKSHKVNHELRELYDKTDRGSMERHLGMLEIVNKLLQINE